MTTNKKIVYFDMDNCLVNFQSGIDKLSTKELIDYGPDNYDEVPGIFSLMDPIEGAIEAFHEISKHYDCYILSTGPWDNPSSWTDKLHWVKKYLPEVGYKRLILSHHKNLNQGDYIIDDRKKNGVEKFQGQHIHFGTDEFPNWKTVKEYLLNNIS